MKYLKTQLKELMLEEKKDKHQKDSFWATEAETNQFDIYHRWMGTPETNPMTVETKLGLSVRTKVEEAFVDMLDKLGVLIKPEEGQHRVEMKREGVKVTGYIDAIIEEEKKQVPIEFKTSFGRYASNDLQQGIVKTHYLKQLAIYMDFLGVEKGYIIQANFLDSFLVEDIYQFTLVRDGDIFKCNNIEFNIQDIYKRWAEIYDKYIELKIEPESEYRYKYPIDELNWETISPSKISKARTNKAVIGDWQALYSSYKDLIIKQEGSSLGYTDEEIEKIKEATKGYSTWNKK